MVMRLMEGGRVNEIMRLISPSFDSTFFPIFDLRNESNVDLFDFARNRICLLCYFSDKFEQKKE